MQGNSNSINEIPILYIFVPIIIFKYYKYDDKSFAGKI